MIIAIVASILGFGLLIFFHELGHFIMAKKIGVKVEKFSLGYGPELLGFTKGETRYLISAFPLGGYVKVAGENSQPGRGERWELNSRSPGERMLVYFFGPLFNFILASLLFTVVFIIGVPTFDFQSTVIGRVTDGYPAQEAGLMAGDEIKTINGEKVRSWIEVQERVRRESSRPITIRVLRQGKEIEFQILPKWDEEIKTKIIGISPQEVIKKFSIFESIKEGFVQTGVLTCAILKGLFLIVFGKAKLDVAGPIGIFQMLGMQAQQGMSSLLYFIGFISVNLAILNLFPIPILDGGVILLLVIEAIRHKPIPERGRQILEQIGLVLLIGLMIFATFKDMLRIR